MIKRRKQHPSQGHDANTAEAAPGRVGRGKQAEARRANSTSNVGPHLELRRVRLKTWSKSDFSIAQTTGQHICTMTCVFFLHSYEYVHRASVFCSLSLGLLSCSNGPSCVCSCMLLPFVCPVARCVVQLRDAVLHFSCVQ